jgi:hypothetical protein
VRQDPSGKWISTDDRWYWTGHSWIPRASPTAWPATQLTFGEAITLPTRDSDWLTKIGLQGLIGLIPILGWFTSIGWMLTYLDHLRLGQPSLPPAGFGYLRRGWRVALVGAIYLGVMVIAFYAVLGVATFGLIATAPHSTGTTSSPANPGPFPWLFFVGIFALNGLIFLVFAALHLLIVPVILRTDRHGVLAGLNVIGAIRMALGGVQRSGVTAILAFFAYFVSSLGVYLLFIGYIFTSAYGWAMLASTVRWYEEREHSQPEVAPPPPTS